MRIVALGQQKGGVGKTTVAVNLACHAIAAGQRAAVIDMDDIQWSAKQWSATRNGEDPAVFAASGVAVKPLIARLHEAGMDWVFIDSPGRSTAGASAGLLVADLVLLPCRPSGSELLSSRATRDILRRAGRRYAYLVNDASTQDRLVGALRMQLEILQSGYPVAPPVIAHRMEVTKAFDAGKAAIEMFPTGRAAEEYASLFAWLEKEVEA